MFSNQIINIEALPNVDTATLKPISKTYLKVIILNKLMLCVVVLAILTAAKFFVTKAIVQERFWFIFLLVLGLWLINLIITILAFKKRKYAIREHDVIYAKGLLVNSITTVPISRIQHIEESRSWLARQFGLATLNLYTAGESGSDLNISGLPHDDARQVNDFISAKINANS
ncbi:PH domain-containing protein [uncultured Psychroserpens sp.]|uniref:PH domain-containing protein n=1 Tax=uncultured Psychroserpens sp. TaxID=255436 RepID=UPI00262EEC6D|nr:PH domain-containing protein [uncultured Psychroserpens sp.]